MTKRPRILIVEDEGIVALNLQHRLQHIGYEVPGVADSGDMALAMVASTEPDLVLMDIHIKGPIDGIEVARQIGEQRSLPVVYLTAYSEDATLERARATRPYGYLIKPFSERELHATIQMALERHEVQMALLDSQRVLGHAMNAANMGLIVIDRDSHTVSLSGEPSRIMGFNDPHTLDLPPFLEHVLDEDRDTMRDFLLASSGTGQPLSRLFRIKRADQRIRWLQVDASPLSPQRVSGVACDVTEREEARILLQQHNLELEQRVRERTAELQRHVRELEAFSHSAAHDLRSPIRAISGLGTVLLEEKGEALGDDGRAMLRRMADSALRMGNLIDSLLGLSKLSRAAMHPREVDLSQMARETAAHLRESEPARVADIDIQDGLCAHADPALVRSVIDNLLRNAWKFSSRRATTQLRFGQTLREGEAAFFIQDNGCGFDSAQAERLFDPFYRAHSEAEYSGTGLGLNIVQRIVARHGGRVWAEGVPDAGATFWFTLPEHAAPTIGA